MTSTDLPVPEPMAVAADTGEYSIAARVLLATFSAAAGAIHLAMITPHAQDSTLDGVLFALAGWFSIIMAFLLYNRPSRTLLGINIVANLGMIAIWAVSRTAGLPWGAHEGVAEDVSTVDLACIGFEAAVVLLSGALLVRPGLLRNLHKTGLALTAGLPLLAVMALTTAALASEDGVHGHDGSDDHHMANMATADTSHDHSDTAQHGSEDASHDHDDMGHSEDSAEHAAMVEDRCDAEFNIASYWEEADIVGVNAHASGESHAHSDDTMEHHANGMHEQQAARLVVDLAEMSDEEYEEWLVNLNPETRDPDAPDDTGSGGHMGPQPWVTMAEAEQCAQLAEELDIAHETAMLYPTVAEAKAAGYFMVAPYVPGIASHWMNFAYVDGEFNVEEPEMLLFDGNADNAQVVGLSYYIIDPGDEQPTAGFTGDNDLYHRHIGLCMKDGVVIADTSTTDEECAALGGVKGGGQAGWMSHAWVVPGCESPWGVFSAANPVLDRALIDNQGEGDPCSGSTTQDRYDQTWGMPDGGENESAAGE